MREKLLMNYGWKFRQGKTENPYLVGHFDSYMISKANNGRREASENYFDQDWQNVNLPHDYVLDGTPSHDFNESQGSYFRDDAWYRRYFKIDKSLDEKRVILTFEGAGKKAIVWLNSQKVGENDSMYNTFTIDITPYVLGDNQLNTLAVQIISSEIEGWWYEGSGINRNVWLEITDAISVDTFGTYVNPILTDNNHWNVEIETTICNILDDYNDITIVQKLYDAQNKLLGITKKDVNVRYGKNIVKQDLQIDNPTLWDLESCYMHKMVTQIVRSNNVVDSYDTSFGFRTILFDGNEGFFLNGKHVKLRGACIHQDHANLGVALPDSIHEYRVQKLKSCGFNAYRSAHNNPSIGLLNACDKLGMLVIDENRWFNMSDKSQYQLSSMLKRDRNHPSVIIWSVGNEEPLQGTPTGAKLVNIMRKFVRTYDTTRPVTLALNGGFYDSYAAKESDVVGVNYNLVGYDKFPIVHPNKCVVATESAAQDNNRGIYFKDGEENPQGVYATAHDVQRASFGSSHADAVEASETHQYVAGTFIWAGIEYRGEASWPRLFSGAGPLDTCCFEKDTFYLLKSIWCDEPILHILPHWDFKDRIGQTIKVYTYSNAKKVELFLNGKSLGKKDCPKFQKPSWDVVYEVGTLSAVGYDENDNEIITAKRETTSAPIKLVLVQDSRKPTNTGEDTVIVNAHLEDEKGRIIPTANNRVAFSVDKNAQIISVSASDPLDHESARATEKNMFNGYIQLVAKVKEGVSKLNITAEIKELGLEQSIQIDVEDTPKIPRIGYCNGTVNIDSFRVWKEKESISAIDDSYNFEDMNTSEPIVIEKYNASKEGGYLPFTAKAVFPECGGATLSVTFSQVGGEYAIKVYHDENCWPHPTPEEFKTYTVSGVNDEPKDVNIRLDGFAYNEKMKIVLVVKNDEKFNIGQVCFEK